MESHKRTLARSITYRLSAWMLTILLSYMYTGNLSESTGFSTFLHLILSLDYYIHERIWMKISWGKI